LQLSIRPAVVSDSEALTNISFSAKRYWNYPEEYFKVWKAELTITPAYIQNNKVYVAEVEGQTVGYFSLVKVEDDFWAGKVFVTKGFYNKIGARYLAESPSSIDGRMVSLFELVMK